MTTPQTTPELLAREKFEAWRSTVPSKVIDSETSKTEAMWQAWCSATQERAAPLEGVSLRESADRLAQAGHDFWSACRKDAGGGAVRWLDLSDGTLIIFTRLEYKQQLLAAVDKIPGIPVVYFDDDGGDEGVSAIAVEKVATESPQPLAPPDTGNVGAERSDWLQESSYRAGAKAGYNLGIDENSDGLAALLEAHRYPRPSAALPPGRGMVPMTKKQINDLWRKVPGSWPFPSRDFERLVRVVEAHHGIKEGSATPLGDGEKHE